VEVDLSHPNSNRWAKLRRVTWEPTGHILSNAAVWSPCGTWIYYDLRSDPAGNRFDGSAIERVTAESGLVETIYRADAKAKCGVVLTSPRSSDIVFIHGPEHPSPQWDYGMTRRSGAILDTQLPATLGSNPSLLDARDLCPPFTVGALRGGTHVHQFDPWGEWISFTYEDDYLARIQRDESSNIKIHTNQRNIGVAIPNHYVSVLPRHPRNQSGSHFCAIVTRTCDEPRHGSDEISKAYEESWIGNNGYTKPDGSRQKRALAFLGDVRCSLGQLFTELFVVDLPDDLISLCHMHWPANRGRIHHRLEPPPEIQARRLTYTADTSLPGIQGPRFWPRSSPDGKWIYVLKKDSQGIVQFWRADINEGGLQKLTSNPVSITSCFTVSGDGKWLAHIMDRSVCVTNCNTGKTIRLTESFTERFAPRGEACVWNPAGDRIAFVAPSTHGDDLFNQVFIIDIDREQLDHLGSDGSGDPIA
jgi:hypothetical protein